MVDSFETRDVALLQPHPRNAALYGDRANGTLLESVRQYGVLQPLLVTRGNVIVSGHRRWDAATRAGLAQVPVVLFPSDDPLEILIAVLESNQQREKTPAQIGNEYKLAKEIEAELAKRQQWAGKAPSQEPPTPAAAESNPDLVVNLPQGPDAPKPPEPAAKTRRKRAPAAGDQAARRIGVSRSTGERAAAAVEALDAARATGEPGAAAAAEIERALDTSVNRAYRTAQRLGYVAPAAPALREAGLDEQLITLDVWHGLTPTQQAQVLTRPPNPQSHLNAQKSDDIEWARWSWNPVTGCLHGCSYCYARDIAAPPAPAPGQTARSGFRQGFTPTFLPERLGAPARTAVPKEAASDLGYRNIFVCSMADLFGRWVPREWIEAVLTVVARTPQWNFLFLTKFPARMAEFRWPENAWPGTTVDAQARVAIAERAFARVDAPVTWLSCEPLLEPLRFSRLDLFSWVVIGGASPSSQTPEWRPPRAWINALEAQAREHGLRVYEKSNLLERTRDYPGIPDRPSVNVPAAFKMGYLQRDLLDPHGYGLDNRAALVLPAAR